MRRIETSSVWKLQRDEAENVSGGVAFASEGQKSLTVMPELVRVTYVLTVPR